MSATKPDIRNVKSQIDRLKSMICTHERNARDKETGVIAGNVEPQIVNPMVIAVIALATIAAATNPLINRFLKSDL